MRGGQGLAFPAVRHEKLRTLTIETGGLDAGVVRGVAASDLPALEHLDLWLGTSWYGANADVADLAPILAGARLPRLRYLALRNSEIQDEIAAAVAGAPVVARLETLDLSMGMLADEGAAALLDGQPLTHLKKLDLHHHYISKPMADRLAGARGGRRGGRPVRGRERGGPGGPLHGRGGVTPVRPSPRLAVVGNPGNRRVALFRTRRVPADCPTARRAVARRAARPGTVPPRRVGADRVARRGSAGGPGAAGHGRRGPGRGYGPLVRAVRARPPGPWRSCAAAAGATLLDDPDELAVLFDKRRCHGVLREPGSRCPPRPRPATPRRGAGLGRRACAAGGHRAAPGVRQARPRFVGVGRARRGDGRRRPGAGDHLGGAWTIRAGCSTRCGCAATTEREVAAIVDALAPDGLHIERWLPKASQGGRSADLRVVVVAGRATHAVVRTSRCPMTNLHLGGARGDLAAARAATEAAGGSWTGMLELCERAAACFPGSLRVGVDLLPAAGWRRFAVGEVNAFGDLLPGLTGLPGSGPRAWTPTRRRSPPYAEPPIPAEEGTCTVPPPDAPPTPTVPDPDMNEVVGRDDLLLVTLDTLRYDVAAELAAAGRTPHLAASSARRALGASGTRRAASPTPPTRRSSPGSCRRRPRRDRTRGCSPRASRAARRPHPGPTSSTPPTSSPGWRRPATTRCASAASASSTSRARWAPSCRGCSRRATGSRSSASHRPPPSRRRSRVPSRSSPGSRTSSGCSCSSTSPRCTSPTGTICRARPGSGRHARDPRGRAGVRRPAHRPAVRRRAQPPALLRHRLLRPRHGLRGGRLHRPPARPRGRVDRAVRPVLPRRGRRMSAPREPPPPVPGLPLRLSAQDGVPAAATGPRCASCGRRSAGRALPLPAHAVLRDALRLLQPVHPHGAPDELSTRYLDALDRQATAVRDALGDRDPVRFAAAAIGGGTPTFLTAGELDRLFDIAEKMTGADCAPSRCRWRPRRPPRPPTGSRSWPSAAPPGSASACRASTTGGPRRRPAAAPRRGRAALARIRDARIPVLNIDLIYGIAGQTAASWRRSLDAALAWGPEELYLYPLYVRPLTGLGRRAAGSDEAWDAQRLALYREGRDHLLAAGYEQVSMRMFRRTGRARAGRGRLRLPGRRHGRPGLRRPLLHPRPALLVRLRRGHAPGPRHHRRLHGHRGLRRAEVGRRLDERGAAPPAAPVAAPGRGPGRGGLPARFGTDPAEDFARSWSCSRRSAGSTDRRTGPAAAHRRGPGPLRRDRSVALLPAVRAAMAAYEPK